VQVSSLPLRIAKQPIHVASCQIELLEALQIVCASCWRQFILQDQFPGGSAICREGQCAFLVSQCELLEGSANFQLEAEFICRCSIWSIEVKKIICQNFAFLSKQFI